MSRYFAIVCFAALALTLGACSHEKAATGAPAVTSSASGRVAGVAPAVSSTPAKSAPLVPPPLPDLGPPKWSRTPDEMAARGQVAPFAATAIPECDQVASVARQCLNTRIRGLRRDSLKSTLERRVKHWHDELASGTVSTADVASQCADFRKRSARVYHAVGCPNF